MTMTTEQQTQNAWGDMGAACRGSSHPLIMAATFMIEAIEQTIDAYSIDPDGECLMRTEKTRVVPTGPSNGYGPGRWLAQYFDQGVQVWFDVGDPHDDENDAEIARSTFVTEGWAMTIHKAAPVSDSDHSCQTCEQTLRRVPGGDGPVWVHSDSGAVSAPNP